MAAASPPGVSPARDPLFWLALAAGPASCALMAWWLPGLRWAPGLELSATRGLLLIAVYPALEEWVFRGQLQPAVGMRWPAAVAGVSAANLFTSLAFSALHLLSHPPGWAAAVFLPSLVFGAFRERSGGLAGPIALHGGYNAAYFLLLAPA